MTNRKATKQEVELARGLAKVIYEYLSGDLTGTKYDRLYKKYQGDKQIKAYLDELFTVGPKCKLRK